MSTQFHANVREKRNILRSVYGGMMTMENIKTELGYTSRTSAIAWVKDVGLEGTRVNRGIRYETDLVAKKIVERRGMC